MLEVQEREAVGPRSQYQAAMDLVEEVVTLANSLDAESGQRPSVELTQARLNGLALTLEAFADRLRTDESIRAGAESALELLASSLSMRERIDLASHQLSNALRLAE